MGAGACQIIITNGNLAYGVVENLADDYRNISTISLEAAINASCQSTLHASLYFVGEGAYHKITSEYTQPIIDLHNEIINDLPLVEKGKVQEAIDDLTNKLIRATKKLADLFDD